MNELGISEKGKKIRKKEEKTEKGKRKTSEIT